MCVKPKNITAGSSFVAVCIDLKGASMKILRAMAITTVIVILFGLTSANASPLAQSPKKLYNAQQKKDVTAWGAFATINWTDPPLNGGTYSDHRVAVLQSSP